MCVWSGGTHAHRISPQVHELIVTCVENALAPDDDDRRRPQPPHTQIQHVLSVDKKTDATTDANSFADHLTAFGNATDVSKELCGHPHPPFWSTPTHSMDCLKILFDVALLLLVIQVREICTLAAAQPHNRRVKGVAHHMCYCRVSCGCVCIF